MSKGPMSKKELLQAALALDAWLNSQQIAKGDRSPVLLQLAAIDIVEQGTTPERFETGLSILTTMLECFSREAMADAKELGIR